MPDIYDVGENFDALPGAPATPSAPVLPKKSNAPAFSDYYNPAAGTPSSWNTQPQADAAELEAERNAASAKTARDYYQSQLQALGLDIDSNGSVRKLTTANADPNNPSNWARDAEGNLVTDSSGQPVLKSSGSKSWQIVDTSSLSAAELAVVNGYQRSNEAYAEWSSQATNARSLRDNLAKSAGGSGGSGGSGGGGSSARELTAYDIGRRQQDEYAARVDDVLGRIKAWYALSDADQDYAGNAIAANMSQQKAFKSGDADWGTGRQFSTVRPGPDLKSQLLQSIPMEMAPYFELNSSVGLPGADGPVPASRRWSADPKTWNIPRWADGTPSAGSGQVGIPTGPKYGSSAQSGWVWRNGTIPTEQWDFNGQAWNQAAISQILDHISSGRGAAAPTGWNGADWSEFVGRGEAGIPDWLVAQVSNWVRTQQPGSAGYEELKYMLGGDRPALADNAYVQTDESFQNDQGAAAAQDKSNLDWAKFQASLAEMLNSQSYGGGGGGGSAGRANVTTYAGQYGSGSGMDAYQQGQLDLAKQELALREKTAGWEHELALANQVLAERKDVRDAVYQEALLKKQEAEQALAQARFEQEKIDAAWNKSFQERQQGWNEMRDERDAQRQRDMFVADIMDRAAARDQDYFKTLVDYGAKGGGDSVARELALQGRPEATGTAYDLLTGAEKGRKTWSQAFAEDAPLYKAARTKTVLPAAANGTGNATAPYAIVGDDPHSNRATGYEELIKVFGDGSYDVIPNRELRAAGIVPGPGRPLPPNIRKPRSSRELQGVA